MFGWLRHGYIVVSFVKKGWHCEQWEILAWQVGGGHGFNRLGESASGKIVGYIWVGIVDR